MSYKNYGVTNEQSKLQDINFRYCEIQSILFPALANADIYVKISTVNGT